LALVEDAAHASGSSLDGRRAGSFGRAGCFSFYPTKVITAGEGGMITTDDDSLAEMAASFRSYGASPNGTGYVRVSGNSRMAEPNAAIGLVQLRRLDEFLARRQQVAHRYDDALLDVRGVKLLPVPTLVQHSYWHYMILLDDPIDRSALARILREEHGVIISWAYDPPCHLQPVFRKAFGYKPGDLPQSERVLRHQVALPMHLALSDEDVDYVVGSLRTALHTMGHKWG
jgi:dTDP-4-amino-4,6-dideoxygalactose transaminase